MAFTHTAVKFLIKVIDKPEQTAGKLDQSDEF